MKKVLSLLGLVAILSMVSRVSPAYAGGHGQNIHAGAGMHSSVRPHGGGHGQVVHAGAGMHRPMPPRGGGFAPPPPPPRRYYGSSAIVGGVFARRGYWCPAYCDYRLGWCDYYMPGFGSSIYIRF